jgi:hypothetical protein
MGGRIEFMNCVSKIISALTVIALSGSLSACAEQGSQLDVEQPSSTPPATPEVDGDASASAPLGPSVVGIPIDLDCNQVLSPEAIYNYNPNVGVDPGYTPSLLAMQALDYGGVACGWINQTSAITLSVAVAKLDENGVDLVREAAAAKSGAVPLAGSDGSFRATDVGGVVEAFVGDYWVIVESRAFTIAEDVGEVLNPLSESLR